jgi:hypothetical protein
LKEELLASGLQEGEKEELDRYRKESVEVKARLVKNGEIINKLKEDHAQSIRENLGLE